ncbi:hypothetical protein M011DRAFT_477634 [Sporormia fimetaria CBS 119925]|uniref:Ubiquitin carboxyl-terminal hydrolase 14 n=1 Tax=Sporormia fimetaria CBS 119925 TaxID=1340428 RepID=A0A6A6VC89_9PLEO|nr:hypothetical protein M011DRAFT_477634 [Sporormia fimetaria CBS 119925]
MGAKSLKRVRDQVPHDSDAAGPPKKRRQGEDAQLVKLYNDLAAESEDVRHEAAKQIIVTFSPESNPSAQAVEKALNRLIRGLCSARKAARLGFCVTLTELLRSIFGQQKDSIPGLNLTIDSIIDLVVEKTKVEGNVPGKDRRDHLIGKLFGYKAVLQSNALLEPSLSLEGWNKVIDHVYGMARDVPWLREECGDVLVDAIRGLDQKSDFQECASQVVQRLVSFNLNNTPEGVAIWLTVKARFENVLPPNVWHHQDPLSKKERQRLAKVLKEDLRSAGGEDAENIKTAAANHNPPFAWNLVLSEMLRRDQAKSSSKDTSKSEFPQFWLDTVDNNLFSASASHERKSWGFKLFSTLIRGAPEQTIPALFSPNLMRCLINQSKKDVRFLHAAALASLNAVQARVQDSPAAALPIVVALTGKNGAIDLDRITRTKTLENVVALADDETLRKIVRHLQDLILRPETQDQAAADSRRQVVADMLLTMVRNYKRYEDGSLIMDEEHDSWLRKVFEVLVEQAYFVPTAAAKTSKIPLPPISQATRKVFQERLSSCLTRLLGVKTKSPTPFALVVVKMIRAKATSSKSLKLVFEAEDNILETVDKAFEALDSIAAKGSSSGKKSIADGLNLLYSLALMQVYGGDGDAILLLEDLDSSRKSLLKGKKGTPSEGQDSFVEILLTFLGNPRTLFRNVAQEAFAVFAPDVTAEGLRSLTNILDTPENLEGQKELFNQEDDAVHDHSDEDDDVEDVEEASDVEMVGGELKTSAGTDEEEVDSDSSDESDSDSGSEEGSDEAEDDEELTNFERMLALTLQTSKPSMDGEDESSDDEDMDDEQMMALDPHLTKIFQERSKVTSKKKEREDAKQTVVQFKSRVLDLLSVLMEKEYSNPLTLEVLVPLLKRIRAGANKQLMDKAFKIVKTYTDSRAHHKAPLPKPTELDRVWDTLRAIHEEAAMGGGFALHATACSNASLHVVKVLMNIDRAHYAQAVDVYAETQKQWFADKKSAVQPSLFTQFLNWSLSDDPAGLDVCLYCFNGGCAGERNHSLLHISSTNHPLVLNIKRTRKVVHREEPPQKISKLSIAAETEEDRYDTKVQVKCSECGIDDINRDSGKLAQVVDAVLKANTFARQEEVKAWEQELTACEHTLCLEQFEASQTESQNLGNCSACDLNENLWLCLTCGNLGCGRAQFGGIGGNSHGLAHTQTTQHPVAVKLGSLTADGNADIYCYACDEERVDPELPNHLAHWGIDIKDRVKTEKSLTEMQVEQNLRWEFSMTTEDGKELKPLFGPGFTGLKNLGNSCYLNSVLQSLFSFPAFANRYYRPEEAPPNTPTPAEDLETQMRKIADGLLSGRYSKPDSDVIVSEHTPENPHQKGLAPAMLKHLIGRGHAEFSTMRQQDAFELMLHLLQLITRSKHTSPDKDPVDAFRFVMEQRLQCLGCKKVRFQSVNQGSLTIQVTVRRIPKDDTMDLTGADGKEVAKEEFQPVPLKECLDSFTAPEMVELECKSCGSKAGFQKRAMFKTFPEVLAINAYRFTVVNWVPTKQDVPVIVGDDAIALDDYMSKGLQEGEEELPEDTDTGAAPKWIPNEAALAMLEAMGFPRVRCEKALHATGNMDPEAASNWLFAHMEDPDIDTPVDFNGGSGTGPSASAAVDPEKIESLGAMGFSAPQARQALKETGGDMERAVDWLFNHPDAQGDFDDGTKPEAASESSEKKVHGSDTLPAQFQLQSIVCHKGTSIHAGHYVAFVRKQIPGEDATSWVLFNDEKVAKAADVEEMKKFAGEWKIALLDHYNHPRNVGSMSKTDADVGTGLVGAPACGDVMKLQIRVDPDNNTISDVKFKTFGCGSAIASSSYLTELVRGMTLEDAAKIRNSQIAEELCLPPVKLHCSMLAEDAIKSAIQNYYTKNPKARKTDLGGTSASLPKVEVEVTEKAAAA